jgi:transketolase
MGLDGDIEDVMGIEPIAGNFSAFGWQVNEIDGHDVDAIDRAFLAAQLAERPYAIIARTRKGKGVRFMEETPHWHLGYLGPRDKEIAIAEIAARKSP